MTTTLNHSHPPGVAQPGGRYRVVISKADRFQADCLRNAVLQVHPSAEVVLCLTAAETLEVLREEPAHLGLVGLTLPDADGLDLLAMVTDQSLAQRCLIVSGRRDERVRRLLKQLPQCDYFDTSVERYSSLVGALQALAKGGTYSSRSRSEGEPNEPKGRLPLHLMFSPRELEMFSLLGTGCDDIEASGRLGMSPATVKSHRARIMRKLGIQSRAELMREAMFRGVVRFGAQRVIRPGFERSMPTRVLGCTNPAPPRVLEHWAVP